MRAEKAIYEAYFNSKQSKLYFNQLKEYTKLSHSSLQNALDKLIKNGLLHVEKTKSNTFYKIKNKKLFALRFSEIAIAKFNNLNLGVKTPLKKFLKEIPIAVYTVIIFGSAARKEEQKESDIDLLIVSDKRYNLDSVQKKINALSNYPLSIFHCSINSFVDNKDPIVVQARKKGFPIYKEQNFYEVILNEY